MNIYYEATVGGNINIDKEEIKGMNEDEIYEYITNAVYELARADLSSELSWEIEKDERLG